MNKTIIIEYKGMLFRFQLVKELPVGKRCVMAERWHCNGGGWIEDRRCTQALVESMIEGATVYEKQ